MLILLTFLHTWKWPKIGGNVVFYPWFLLLQSELSNSNALGTGYFLGMSNYLGATPFFKEGFFDSLTQPSP